MVTPARRVLHFFHMNPHSRVAVITGAGSGIGKSVALALLREGYSVAFAGRRTDVLEAAAAEAGAARPGIRRGELVLQEGMGLEIEPNACLGMVRVNIGAGVLVTSRGAEELNSLATRVRHVG